MKRITEKSGIPLSTMSICNGSNRRSEEKGEKNILKEIMTKYFPKLLRNNKLHIWEARPTDRHIMAKMIKVKHKKILKAT